MTTTTEYLGDEALDELLNEADNLMIDLDVNDNNDAEAIGDANGDDLVIDGFAIDSDEEDDGGASTSNKNNQSVDVHPLSDEWIAANAPPPAPLSSSAPPSVGSGTFVPTPGMATVGTAQTNEGFGVGGVGGMVHSNPLAGGAVTMDNLKQQTSRFASNLANMAQRAASQVASVTVVQPNPMMMAQPMPPQQYGHQNSYASQQQQLQHQMQHQQVGIPQSPGILSSSAAGGQQQQQQQPNAVSASGASELDKDQINRLVEEHAGELLPGERIIMFLSNLLHVGDTTGLSYASNQSSDAYMWCCAMSYYRVILFSTTTSDQQRQVSLQCPDEWDPRCWPAGPEAVKFLEMPLASIDRVEKSIYQANNSSYLGIIMHSKDGSRNMRFSTPSHADTGQAFKSLQTYSFPGRRNLGYLFAFESKRQKVMASVKIDATTGQQTIAIPPTSKRFDAMIEYPRLLSKSSTTQCPWAIWASVNSSYGLSPSYPSVLCGPATLDETKQDTYIVIRQCAAFRSEQRMPSLTWCSVGGSSIWRSSQPKIGLQGNRSQADELFIRHIVESARSANAIADPPPIYSRMALQRLTGDCSKDWTPEPGCGLKIMDLRPRSSAMANRTGGYGYENTSNYSNTTLQFCNIGNIHAIRDSYLKLCVLCNSGTTADVNWNVLVEDTRWLSHSRLILAASWETAYWAHIWRMPVLVHCSHGWDRTSQVVALAELLLDPHYRTCEGFSCLVEKDFMSFGHPFHTRCGHGEGRSEDKTVGAAPISTGNADDSQVSPIFLQFLDCVYQIVKLYPDCFEFNTKYLLELSRHISSCRFGSMLCDTEREREALAGIRQRTYAVWDYLDSVPEYRNPVFERSQRDGVLLMPLPVLLRNVQLWQERHCQFSPKVTMSKVSLGQRALLTTSSPKENGEVLPIEHLITNSSD